MRCCGMVFWKEVSSWCSHVVEIGTFRYLNKEWFIARSRYLASGCGGEKVESMEKEPNTYIH